MSKKKHSFDLITPADALAYDPLAISKETSAETTKVKGRKKPVVDYVAVKKDFIKTDRNIIDVVLPYLVERYNSGTAILYLTLYRLSYGFRKNRLKISDDDLSKRTSIPKRTLAKYRDDLDKCDLVQYEKGYKTTRKPEYTILLPHQSKTFTNILHNNANILPKNVKSPVDSSIYKVIDKHTINIEAIVREFYSKIGKTEYSLTRKMLGDGIHTLQALLVEGYSLSDVKECIAYMLKEKEDIYSINYINYAMSDYQIEKAEISKKKKAKQIEADKEKERNKRTALDNHLQNLFDELPKDKQNMMLYEAEAMAHKYMKDEDIKYGEKYIISDYLNGMIKELFSDVVRGW